MRISKQLGKLTVQAVAGTHVVLLGWSMTKADSRHVLGFAVHRTDHTEDEAYWLEGIKVFAETDPGTERPRYVPIRCRVLLGPISRPSRGTIIPTA